MSRGVHRHMAAQDQPRFLTIKDVAAELATSESQIRALLSSGICPRSRLVAAGSGASNGQSSRITSPAHTHAQPNPSNEAWTSLPKTTTRPDLYLLRRAGGTFCPLIPEASAFLLYGVRIRRSRASEYGSFCGRALIGDVWTHYMAKWARTSFACSGVRSHRWFGR